MEASELQEFLEDVVVEWGVGHRDGADGKTYKIAYLGNGEFQVTRVPPYGPVRIFKVYVEVHELVGRAG